MPPLHEQICWYFWLQHSHCNNSAKARHTTRFGLSQGGRFGSFLRAYIENRMCIDDSSTSSPPTTCKNVEKSRRGPPSPVKVTRMYVRIIHHALCCFSWRWCSRVFAAIYISHIYARMFHVLFLYLLVYASNVLLSIIPQACSCGLLL